MFSHSFFLNGSANNSGARSAGARCWREGK